MTALWSLDVFKSVNLNAFNASQDDKAVIVTSKNLGPLLPTWFNLNPSMDK